MTETRRYESWKEVVAYSDDRPNPIELFTSEHFKIVIVGLEADQKIPPHDGPAAVYQVLEGSGAMIVDGERLSIAQGSIVAVANGSSRGVEADTRLALYACRDL